MSIELFFNYITPNPCRKKLGIQKKLRNVSQRPLIHLNLNYEKIYLFCLRYKFINYFLSNKFFM